MSVQSGRRTRQLLPVAMAFRQLNKPTILKPHNTFEKTSIITLGGIVLGTMVSTVGIIYKQTVLIWIGFIEMILIVLWIIIYFYSS